MESFSIQDISSIIGVGAIFVSGANFVIVAFWKLTFKRKEEDDIQKFEQMSKRIDQLDHRADEDRRSNEAFRHKYKSTVENLYELIKLRFDDWDKNLDSFKKAVEDKIDLAILKNEKRNEKRK